MFCITRGGNTLFCFYTVPSQNKVVCSKQSLNKEGNTQEG